MTKPERNKIIQEKINNYLQDIRLSLADVDEIVEIISQFYLDTLKAEGKVSIQSIGVLDIIDVAAKSYTLHGKTYDKPACKRAVCRLKENVKRLEF